MIEGVVNAAHEAVVTLPLRDPSGQEREIEAVIDTGFSGFLMLPPSLVEELGLPFRFHGQAVLANGEVETFAVHGVTVVWDGQLRDVESGAVGVEALVGMSLLDMHDLSIQVRDGGRVVIQPMA